MSALPALVEALPALLDALERDAGAASGLDVEAIAVVVVVKAPDGDTFGHYSLGAQAIAERHAGAIGRAAVESLIATLRETADKVEAQIVPVPAR